MKHISRTARCAALFREGRLAPQGLGGHQHIYIFNICSHPGISQEELAKIIFVNKSNVARQLACLEQNGFVTRTPLPADRRQMQVFPTAKALAVLPRVREVVHELNAYLLEDFTEAERQLLCAMMERIAGKAMAMAKQLNE